MTRDPKTWRSKALKAFKKVPWKILAGVTIAGVNAVGLIMAEYIVATETGIWAPYYKLLRSLRRNGYIGTDFERSWIAFMDTYLKPIGYFYLSSAHKARALANWIASKMPWYIRWPLSFSSWASNIDGSGIRAAEKGTKAIIGAVSAGAIATGALTAGAAATMVAGGEVLHETFKDGKPMDLKKTMMLDNMWVH
eukprot:jgi/Mesvir1/26700/Mv20478-RA.1